MKTAIKKIKQLLPETISTIHDDIKYVDLVKEIKRIINEVDKQKEQV
jgi:hypothetical protein